MRRTASASLLLTIVLSGIYTSSAQAECYSLTLKVAGGRGEAPRADPRPNCSNSGYFAGTQVRLVAQPASRFTIYRWSGVDDTKSQRLANTVTITGDTAVSVYYVSQDDPAQEVRKGTPGGIARAPQERLHGKSVIGTDQRSQVTTTTTDPWRRHAQLVMTFPSAGVFICTGFFIAPDVLGTAGHCVYDSDEGGWATSIEVIPARNGDGVGSEPFGRQTSTDYWSVNGWVNSGLPEYDYGAVILPDDTLATAVGLGSNWFHIKAFSDAEISAFTFANISGYPGDKPTGTQWYDAQEITTVTSTAVSYETDTAGGQSGSAVYGLSTAPRRYAYAVHAYGVGGPLCNSGDNCGPRIRDEVASFYYNRGAPLLSDNFETGDLSAWSSTFP